MKVGSVETGSTYELLRQDIKDAIMAGKTLDQVISYVDTIYLHAYSNGQFSMFEKCQDMCLCKNLKQPESVEKNV